MTSLKRKRARLACKPCRERKRKCDGNDPCITCAEWGYECSYESNIRFQSSRTIEQSSADSFAKQQHVRADALTSRTTESEDRGVAQRLEANSGAAFVRKLGLKIDPTKAPKLNLFSWNIGARQLSSQFNAALTLPIKEITSLEQIKSLAQAYFDKVGLCYGFIDHRQFLERLDMHWKSPVPPSIFDSVICGVAAIGCLFSQQNATVTELQLVRSAQSSLDSYHLTGPPPIDFLVGWALRCVYLRLTDLPHSTWMASCTLMHLIEASGLHPESPSILLRSVQCDPEFQRRLVGVAYHLNAWTSFDLGLARVSFQDNNLPLPPTPKPGDYTAEVLGLLPMSISLDPTKAKDDTNLPTKLQQVLGGTHTPWPSVMAQCNLVLCILRHLHAQNVEISSELTENALTLLKKGLGCARNMVMDCSPWHQVANVPFQTICVLLVMDTRSSLAILPEAMQTLSFVASTYDTEVMREAYKTACLLLLLHQQRRKDDIAVFSEALNIPQQEQDHTPTSQSNLGVEENSWLGALVADLPGLQQADLDQFMGAEFFSGQVQ